MHPAGSHAFRLHAGIALTLAGMPLNCVEAKDAVAEFESNKGIAVGPGDFTPQNPKSVWEVAWQNWHKTDFAAGFFWRAESFGGGLGSNFETTSVDNELVRPWTATDARVSGIHKHSPSARLDFFESELCAGRLADKEAA